MGLTLDQIRQQFNIPRSVSDAEVVRIAQENNIVIDFSGSGAQSIDLGTNEAIWFGQGAYSTGDTYDNMVSFGNTSQTAQGADQNNETLEQKLAKYYGNLYTDADPAKKQELVKQYIKNILNDKTNPTALEDLKRLVANTSAESEIAQALLEAIEESGNEELKAALPENFAEDVKAANKGNSLEQRTTDILKQIYGDKEVKIKSKEVKDGKQVIVTEDGKTIEIPLQEGEDGYDSAKVRADVSYIVYQDVPQKNGKVYGGVTIVKTDGTKISRKARFGEIGFNEKGENFDQRLQRYFNISSDEYMELSDDEKKKYSARYQQGIRKTAYDNAIKKGKSEAEAQRIADDAVINDFRALCRRSGKSPEEMKGIAITLFGLSPEVAEQEVQKYIEESTTPGDAAVFARGIQDNIHLADSPEIQVSITKGVSEGAKTLGISDEVSKAIGDAITANKFHGREATIEALRTQYGLSAEEANEYYSSLPEETRQKIEDVTLDAISTVQTEVAADSSQSEDVRHAAADLSTSYMTYIDDAEYQMQVIQNNNNYILQNADEEMQQYYNNSIAENAYNYDLSNRDDIIRMVQELGNEKTLEILENARKEYEAQAAEAQAIRDAQKAAEAAKKEKEQQAKTNEKTVQKPAQDDNRTAATTIPVLHTSSAVEVKSIMKSDGISKAVTSKSFRAADAKTKENILNSLSQSGKKEAIQSIVEGSQAFQLDAYMFSGLKNAILKYLVSHPTPKNTEKLNHLQQYLSPADKEMLKKIKEEMLQRYGKTPTVEQPKDNQSANTPVDNHEASTIDKDVNNPFKFGFINRH